MIKSTLIKLNKPENFDNLYIEKYLSKFYNTIIRWAIIEIDETSLTIRVSYLK